MLVADFQVLGSFFFYVQNVSPGSLCRLTFLLCAMKISLQWILNLFEGGDPSHRTGCRQSASLGRRSLQCSIIDCDPTDNVSLTSIWSTRPIEKIFATMIKGPASCNNVGHCWVVLEKAVCCNFKCNLSGFSYNNWYLYSHKELTPQCLVMK